MQLPASRSPRTPADEAVWLKAYLGTKNPDTLQAPDLFLMQTVRRLSALELITIADIIAFPPGAPHLIHLYKMWIDAHGNGTHAAFAVWYNLGIQYGAAGDPASQITCYKNALAIKPDLYQAAVNLGLAHEAAGQYDLALEIWQKTLQPTEARTSLLNHCGRVFENTKKLDAAEAKYRESLLLAPDQSDVLHHWIGLRTRMCLWPVYDTSLPGVTRAAMVSATRALTLLAMADDTARQTAGNLSWITEKMPPASARLTDATPYGHDRLRIGYISSDFCRHPIAYLVTELFELHDRDRFEIYGYCSTKDDGSEDRRRIHRAFDTCVDIRAMDDADVARKIRADEIDILVDLNGLTLGTRLQVLRWKPAPVQMTYLGYNGPVPLPELDYIIADDFVIPRANPDSYQPAPLYVPHCFQVNDSKLEIATPPARDAVGLPTDAFVFCSFSNTYKVTEAVYDAWMEILRRADGSVLWLFVDNPYAMANLKDRALRAGIASNRLIFASRVEPSEYRARLALADLFLDTYPYNSGTTASDALRVGLPLITVAGESFTSRMAGSLLTVMGLEDGIVQDHAAYIELAVALASDRSRYRALKARVTPERWNETLGDTKGFCRRLEAAFESVAVR